MKKTKYSNMNLIELLIEYDKATRNLEELKKPDSKIVSNKVNEIWGDKKGLSDNQKKELNEILNLI
jgi:acyl-CoA-binding protein